MKASDLFKLSAPFPKEDIHWRAQTVRKDGTKALALAYIDSRDVQERLDAVCGPAGWQTRHRDMGNGKLSCEIGILVDGEWIWKSDGAGATDVEGDKGAFSDSLKRAAVSWGIGRYLYDLGQTWVPCKAEDTGQKDNWGNIKWRFVKFTDDPWNHVKGNGKVDWTGPLGKHDLTSQMRTLANRMRSHSMITTGDLEALEDEYSAVIEQAARDLPEWARGYEKSKKELLSRLQVGERTPDPDEPASYQEAS